MPVAHTNKRLLEEAAWQGNRFCVSIADDTDQEDDQEIARATQAAYKRVLDGSTEDAYEPLAIIAACCAVMSYGWRDVDQPTRDLARHGITIA